MDYILELKQRFLWIPVAKKQPKVRMEIWAEGVKKLEFMVPFGQGDGMDYVFDFYAPIRCDELLDKELRITGEFSDSFYKQIRQSEEAPAVCMEQPFIHFRPGTGWLNDPNGLVYKDGVYHMYFQYNPLDTEWDNMSWGHGISRDLLHWKQCPDVLYPDADGMMFSGCGLVNDRKCLGLNGDTLLFFYSVAGSANPWSKGKDFVQRLAYSTDGGYTFHKMNGWEMPTVCKENRDPKIFWHEDTGRYVMVLWLEENDFGIFLSEDLKEFIMSQRLTFDKLWECPDLCRLTVEGSQEQKWIFWSADGYYHIGDFDGECFQAEGERLEAYGNKLPYAAQTYSGIQDRIISVPWLRTGNQDRNYHGVMGLPRELSLCRTESGLRLAQNVVREWDQGKKQVICEKGCTCAEYSKEEKGAVEVILCSEDDSRQGTDGMNYSFDAGRKVKLPGFTLTIMGTMVQYEPDGKLLCVGEEKIELIEGLWDISFLSDGEIIEITGNSGIIVAMFERSGTSCGRIAMESSAPVELKVFEG